MDRSNSVASTSSTGNGSNKPGSSTPFAYQTRLLEGTSPRSGSISVSRTGSLSRAGPLPIGTNSPTPTITRRWTPTHRVGSSLDAVRGKFEERIRAEAALDERASPSDTKVKTDWSSGRSTFLQSFPYTKARSIDHLPSSDPPILQAAEMTRTPTYLKRRTLPAPIIASPLSPNTTGVSVVNPNSSPSPFATPPLNRIHLPSSTPLQSSSVQSAKRLSAYTVPSPTDNEHLPFPRARRSNTVDSVLPTITGSSTASERSSLSAHSDHDFSAPSTPLRRRPTSLYGSQSSTASSPDRFGSNSSFSIHDTSPSQSRPLSAEKLAAFTSSSTPSITSPAPYRSSYLSSKKASTYGENLIVGRKLGRHLPRIASGDADDDWVEGEKTEETEEVTPDRQSVRERRRHERDGGAPLPERRRSQDLVIPGVTNADEVAGIPGRLRLSRDRVPSTPVSPLPSARLARGSWADVQRHLLQAYEYLCHVGEAQQWIEGCLGEELGFGVVEMEEGLRNGAPKLDFRHSDNINIFVNFVRQVGLPESFIFELTDLYEKKNFPKIIYCIHALSHLLARRGMAERIGNLLGQLQFSDDQLRKTQKGLKDAGVPMPNFGNVGKELAKEIDEEPEIEIETEDERRDRLLLENESSIIATQSIARAFLVRKTQATQRARLQMAERYVPRFQAHCRGVLARRLVEGIREDRADLTPWVLALQATSRGFLARGHWLARLRRVKSCSFVFTQVQAQGRGYLIRHRFAKLKAAIRGCNTPVLKLQSLARARIVQRQQKKLLRVFASEAITDAIVGLQAVARGILIRRTIATQLNWLDRLEPSIIAVQAHCRGVLVRRRVHTQLAKLEDITQTVIRIQAAVRTYLARKRLLTLIRGLRKATPVLVQLQARARANLARQEHQSMNKALIEDRSCLSRWGNKRLEFSAPDVVGFQAVARGALIRREYYAWHDHLWRSQGVAVFLQALLRGVLQRRKFRAKMQYYRANLDKVVKIQSLFRAKETREQYRQLTLGTNVTVGTIKNFVHLLDDSEADFQEEVDLERTRKLVVERIRENQALESDINDLDVKIALVVQNVKSFEELIKARRRYGADSAAAHAARASVLAAHGDPFAGPNTLDHAAKRKLELYQQLFYLLQAKGEYLSKLFSQMSMDSIPEKNRRLLERVVLTLFGYGQDRREDYLLLKLFQFAIIEEIANARSIEDVIHGHPMYINIAVHYIRPKQTTHVREALQPIIREVINADDLDLEVDPTVIYKAKIDAEEMRSGVASTKAKDVAFRDALNDPVVRPEYIRHLQVLQWWTEAFVAAITQSTKKMPYGMRFLARETLFALRHKFPDASEEAYASCIGRLVFYRYINPAIITPETFGIVSNTVDIGSRKNLAQISKVLSQLTTGMGFGDESPSYIPINEFVNKAIKQVTHWLLEVADVPDAETQYHAHEFLDATVQPKPIYISPNEVYAMHGLLAQHIDSLAPSREDTLRVIIHELDGVPHLGSEELKDARDRAITLDLTNRFAHVNDPRAEEKTLWIQAKRTVLAILRVQPGKDLVESLMQPVSDEHELMWEEVLETEMADNQLKHPRRMPSSTAQESGYRLEDIRSLSFREVKAHAIFFLLELEKRGKITREDGYQGILNAIANDVRSKHRMRLQRQKEIDSMKEALRHLSQRKKEFEEQINSYNNYIETAMATMQRGKGKKRFVMPFTKQYFHLRDLQKSGKTPQFGSFKYSAQDLYDKGILLSIDQFSPRQFDKIDLVLSSNQVGVFAIEVFNHTLGITNRVAAADVRMEDLLQAQFQDRASLSLFNGLAKFNLNLLLYQINKKFYV
ncbi:hypothetical protein EW146_g1464 [Bondarzewia mesenterica]|uniref:Ras-GAP domain-containing protein n=1 Tax=Bondarzewia mesenterica TaxID=1095465 RepID=A0A4S4M5M7_9AGAM|nr:hypothetical protein EW146_g1464 [Bondarzewia mesenterica]